MEKWLGFDSTCLFLVIPITELYIHNDDVPTTGVSRKPIRATILK